MPDQTRMLRCIADKLGTVHTRPDRMVHNITEKSRIVHITAEKPRAVQTTLGQDEA